MTIARILKNKGGTIVTVPQTMPVIGVANVLRERGIGAVLVTDVSGDLIGIVSERDIVRGLATLGGELLEKAAGTIMTSPVITCTPEDTVQSAMELMTSRRFRHLPVIDNGRLTGIVSIGDLVKLRIQAAEQEAGHLREYIAMAG
ncbi:CBS domain-containing protein [Hankyongella ginsenosidimutans]|uniref:CBS domain-containing protein n=1 Tax=Hankyongella ginsenosidimutans TaxID=1763828 RepID=A0A4D7CB95_9SPHN|nr:CBS domain-containing protein [Hankyongella ginsenosidimutans]QCI79206.1 CBS domain-containing protein [Hankyongella ginsenosidimutans]